MNMVNKLEILPKIYDEEVEILKEDRFVKYLFTRNDSGFGKILIAAGNETSIQDVIQSIFAVISAVYQGLDSEPSESENAALLRTALEQNINSEDFWKNDGEKLTFTRREDDLVKQRKLS